MAKPFTTESVNWKYLTEAVAGINNRQSYWPRGKVVGGSSSINAHGLSSAASTRISKTGANSGNPGWGWQDVLPYFRKMETYSDGALTSTAVATDRSTSITSVQSVSSTVPSASSKRAQQCGFDYNPDFNGVDQEGVGFYQITTQGRAPHVDGARLPGPGAETRATAKSSQRHRYRRIVFEGNKQATGSRVCTKRQATAPGDGEAVKSWSAQAPSIHRNCCSYPVSAPGQLLQRFWHRNTGRSARSWP